MWILSVIELLFIILFNGLSIELMRHVINKTMFLILAKEIKRKINSDSFFFNRQK